MHFREVTSAIMSGVPPSSGGNLAGMLEDVERRLSASGAFSAVTASLTARPMAMIQATCRPAVSGMSVANVRSELKRVWTERLRYRAFQSHVVVCSGRVVTLRGITGPTDSCTRLADVSPASLADITYYVTVEIVVNLGEDVAD